MTEIRRLSPFVNRPKVKTKPLTRTEGTFKLHCFCLCQAVQVEKKETEQEEGGKDKENIQEKGEEADQEKEKESGPEGGSMEDKKENVTEEEDRAPSPPRRPKTLQIKVTLLDNTLYECELDVRAF